MAINTQHDQSGMIVGAFATDGDLIGPSNLVAWFGNPVGSVEECTKANARSWMDNAGNCHFGGGKPIQSDFRQGVGLTTEDPRPTAGLLVLGAPMETETMADQFRKVYIGALEAVLFRMPENQPIDTNFVLAASKAALDAWDAFASTMEELTELRSQIAGHEIP